VKPGRGKKTLTRIAEKMASQEFSSCAFLVIGEKWDAIHSGYVGTRFFVPSPSRLQVKLSCQGFPAQWGSTALFRRLTQSGFSFVSRHRRGNG